MLLNALVLSISASIDSFGVGITYGIKKTKISIYILFILFLLSVCITGISTFFGNALAELISPNLVEIIGSLILLFIGIFIIFGAIFKKEKPHNPSSKEYSFFIKFLGITISIIKNPINSDIDKSNIIDLKEAIFLGIALSLDATSIGFGSATIGVSPIIFTILTSIFQIIFLCLGKYFGNKINKKTNIPNNIWNISSGVILIFLGIIKLLS